MTERDWCVLSGQAHLSLDNEVSKIGSCRHEPFQGGLLLDQEAAMSEPNTRQAAECS